MKKLESTLLYMVLSLTIVSLVAGASLGFMNELTKGPKAESRRLKQVEAIKSVIPDITNDPFSEKITLPVEGQKDSLLFFPGRIDDKLSGVAVSSFTYAGYSGLIKLMVGFNMEGMINNISVLYQKETPGLGTKMTSESFVDQFIGKNPGQAKLKPVKDGGEIDALTGATITTRAYCEAVQLAYDSLMKEKNNIK
jgi:electron transport complex protein RnfG